MRTTFEALRVGQAFTVNGSDFIKKSSRTAYVGPNHPVQDKSRWFYFGLRETVCVHPK